MTCCVCRSAHCGYSYLKIKKPFKQQENLPLSLNFVTLESSSDAIRGKMEKSKEQNKMELSACNRNTEEYNFTKAKCKRLQLCNIGLQFLHL